MRFISAGERVYVEAEPAWATRLVERALGGADPSSREGDDRPTVHLRIEASRTAFASAGLRSVARGVVSDGRHTVLSDVGGSGFDLLVEVGDGRGTQSRAPAPRETRGGGGRRLRAGVAELTPAGMVVRGRGPRPEVTAIGRDGAAGALIAGPYAGGERRGYWAFGATLALATGRGPTHPPVAETA